MTSQTRSLSPVLSYYALACGLTWTFTLPATLAFARQQQPSALAVAGAGLSAFGPLLAALFVSWREGSTREVFFRLRTAPRVWLWVLLALATPIVIRLLAASLTVAFGFELSKWVYPPALATQVAALVVFPLGEEFGWRGFAYPRLKEHLGLVKGSLVLGVMWSLWHLGYIVNPETGDIEWVRQLESVVHPRSLKHQKRPIAAVFGDAIERVSFLERAA